MELPAVLRAAVERELEGVPLAKLREASSALSARYRAETLDGRLHLDADLAVKAYLAARLPATYAAVRTSLAAADEVLDFQPETLLDFGAGPGTALWAAKDCWPTLRNASLVEASNPARHTGAALARGLSGLEATWLAASSTIDLKGIVAADVVTLCYVLDELQPAAAKSLMNELWARTTGLFVIVEPGTPAGWRRILAARGELIASGAEIVAPCPHQAPCPLRQPDWCHFSRRVARSRVHRLAKEADAPFEDEKFIYLAASRSLPRRSGAGRIIAPPYHSKGGTQFKLCTPDGEARQQVVARRDKAEFRAARQLDWGDLFEPS